MMTRPPSPNANRASAHSLLLRLALPPYTIHFKSPTYLQTKTLDLLDRKVSKETLHSTAQNILVREAIGTDPKFWAELFLLLRAAILSLERRSFSIWDPDSVDYESTSGSLIAGHYPGLWRDVERINDLVSIARNVLTGGPRAQNLAAEHGVDGEIFKLINCCVRVTARGFDGNAGTNEEERWQGVVNAYKKLLITSLQWLNNFVAKNERRKFLLWVNLFDKDAGVDAALRHMQQEAAGKSRGVTESSQERPEPPINNQDILLAYGVCGSSRISPLELEAARMIDPAVGFKPPPTLSEKGRKAQESSVWVYFTSVFRYTCVEDFMDRHKRHPTLAEIHRNMPKYWHEQIDKLKEQGFQAAEKELWGRWLREYGDALRRQKDRLNEWEEKREKMQVAAATAAAAESKGDEENNQKRPSLDVTDEAAVRGKIKDLETQLAERYRAESTSAPSFEPPTHSLDGNFSLPRNGIDPPAAESVVEQDEFRMLFTAEAGARILESGKAELMKRLDGYGAQDRGSGDTGSRDRITNHPTRLRSRSLSPSRGEPIGSGETRRNASDPSMDVSGVALQDAFAQGALGSEEDEDEDEDEDDEDEDEYPNSTEDGRGLLTDVPLILGPSEIEVLPMLIMSGLIPTTPSPGGDRLPDESSFAPTHTLRTHLLLAAPLGRNLLRELLIFVAAWDLREEELYFKFMVKILEAILSAGLLPYAYHAFRDRSRSKDIISPAQAVVMKLLTGIMRARSSDGSAASHWKDSKALSNTIDDPPDVQKPRKCPTKVDLHVLNFIFTEFRQHIIPQTCALIFLQGQIHAGRANAEDFPLNLWDMERMYEGVYQFLEFFAVLCEEGAQQQQYGIEGAGVGWKVILAEWEMSCELVTLLRELEAGIPKGGSLRAAVQQQVERIVRRSSAPTKPSFLMQTLRPEPGPVAVERPFDVDPNCKDVEKTTPSLSSTGVAAATGTQIETSSSVTYPASPGVPQTQADQEEPSDFEWRNLKKLAVLVLSSLIWKNPLVQRQVREAGGLGVLVRCCEPDEHNPYIREHAIMCLRFAVEGDAQSEEVVRRMSGFGTDGARVPSEVLDQGGYETFVDARGCVGLRRKTVLPHSSPQPAHAPLSTNASAAPSAPRLSTGSRMTAEKAAELMQNALKDLPLGSKMVTDQQKAEALARLDRAFETTERAFGAMR